MSDKYYAVANGRKTGIYDNWIDCQAQTKKFPNAKFKSFFELEDAENYLNNNGVQNKKIDSIQAVKQENNNDILYEIFKIAAEKLDIDISQIEYKDLSQIENKDYQSGFTSINHDLDDLKINKSQQQELQQFLQNNK